MMKNEPFNQKTPAELELEDRLTRALAQLPDSPVASNFTTRLMAAVDLDAARPPRRLDLAWIWRSWLPRLAVTSAVVLFAGLTFWHYEATSQRTTLAQNIALVAGSQPLPGLDTLNDFEAIYRMNQPAPADEELLALLQ